MKRIKVVRAMVCVGAVFVAFVAAADLPRYEYVLNLVHHNPGEPRFVTEFNSPSFLKSLGYTGQIPKLEPQCGLTYDRYERGLVPLHSPEREWMLRQAAEFRKTLAIAKKAGCPLYPWIDVLVVPKSVMAKYGAEMKVEENGKRRLSILRPRTQALMVAQVEEFFWRYPDAAGLTIRFGETYLQDAPFHTGSSPVKTVEEHIALVNLLREEVCVKRGKTLIYRTWSFDGLHTNPKKYLALSDGVEPHPNLIFSIKHANADFMRGVPFNRTIGIGRHLQIIEVSMNQGGLYGKNAYPYYFARGVLDGFHDMPEKERRGLRSLNDNPLVRGIWLWTWGDGWSGPFFDNEFWLRLNEAVVRGFALNPEKSEEELFNAHVRGELGFDEENARRLRAFCLATEDAVYNGQHSPIRVWMDSVFWCRDNHFCRTKLDDVVKKGVFEEMLAGKKANLETWRQLEREIREIKFPREEDGRFATLSTTYGRIKYEVGEIVWRLQGRLTEERLQQKTVTPEEAAESLKSMEKRLSELESQRTKRLEIIERLKKKENRTKAVVEEINALQGEVSVLDKEISRVGEIVAVSRANLAHIAATAAETLARRKADAALSARQEDDNAVHADMAHERSVFDLAMTYEGRSLDRLCEAIRSRKDTLFVRMTDAQRKFDMLEQSLVNADLLSPEQMDAMKTTLSEKLKTKILDAVQ